MYVFLDLKQEKLFWNLLDDVSRETLKVPRICGAIKGKKQKWKLVIFSDNFFCILDKV